MSQRSIRGGQQNMTLEENNNLPIILIYYYRFMTNPLKELRMYIIIFDELAVHLILQLKQIPVQHLNYLSRINQFGIIIFMSGICLYTKQYEFSSLELVDFLTT